MAILRHETTGGPHWDWLFSRVAVPQGADLLGPAGEPRQLAGYRITTPLAFEQGQARIALGAKSMPDHRLRYLAFEGDIGQERGIVARVAQGCCAIEGEQIRFTLQGIPGVFTWTTTRTGEGCAVTIARTCAHDALHLAAPPNR